MFNISKYLEKFKEISSSKEFLIKTVAEAIKEVCKIEIDIKKIQIKSGVVKINESPIKKTEVFLKKVKILELLDKKVKGKIREIL